MTYKHIGSHNNNLTYKTVNQLYSFHPWNIQYIISNNYDKDRKEKGGMKKFSKLTA